MAASDLVKNNISIFLEGFLSRPASAISKGAQWIVSFEEGLGGLKPITTAIKKAYEYEPERWTTLETAETVLTDFYQRDRGCMFCQAIGLPGEGAEVNVEGSIKSNAFIRSYVGAGRNDFPKMRMTFLDTNVSFADSFLRGWALATANFGLIARTGDLNYRTDIICHKFAITPKGPYVIQTIKFKDACCISVSEEEYQYTHATTAVLREAQFIYNSYSIDTVTGNSGEITINKVIRQTTPIPSSTNQPSMVYQPTPPNPSLNLNAEGPVAFTPEQLTSQAAAAGLPTFL